MSRQVEDELQGLKELALRMGALVERAIFEATRAVSEADVALANRVIEHEGEVNRMQLELDGAIVTLLGSRQLAPDELRFVLAVGRINAELERIGDQAVNIAEASLRLSRHARAEPEVDLPRMASLAASMVRDALNALVDGDVAKAQTVLVRDDDVDAARDEAFRVLLAQMTEDSKKVLPAFEKILIAKNLERIGDLATNISEAVIFSASGRDVRHRRLATA